MFTPKRKQALDGNDAISLSRHGGNSPFKSLNLSMNEERDNSFNKTFMKHSTFQVLEDGDRHQLVTYGTNLPFEVAKFLANPNASSKIDDNGWAIFVCNRYLYIWRYTASTVKKPPTCFELQLSPSDLTHTANLTCIIHGTAMDITTSSVNIKTAVLNLSPEGSVRYWQNIARPSAIIESTIELGGKICHSLIPVMPHGCILLTTTNEIFLLVLTTSSVTCRQLNLSSGMLSNLGKRVSSFWSHPDHVIDKFLPSICEGIIDYDSQERCFYAVIKGNLQKWRIDGSQVKDCTMLFDVSVQSSIKFKTGSAVNWNEVCDVQVLDIKNTGYGTVLLTAILQNNDDFQCCIATFKTFSNDDVSVENVLPIYHNFKSSDLQKLALTIPHGSYEAFISSSQAIVCQSVSRITKEPIIVQFNEENNSLIGAGICGNEPIFVSQRNGLITLKIDQPNESFLIESSATPSSKNASTIQEEKKEENMEADEAGDLTSVVKNMFIKYTKTEQVVLDLQDYTKDEMRNAVLSTSSEILDSPPATDPRWAEGRENVLQTSSVLLLNQLKDKLEIFETFLKFLDASSLLDKLEDLTERTRYEICEHGERLQASLTLLSLYEQHGDFIDKIIENDQLEVDGENSTNKKDIFFTKVTSIDFFFLALLKQEEILLKEMEMVKEQIELIVTTSNILTNCFTSSWHYRQNYQNRYHLSHNTKVPWTGSTDGNNNRKLIKSQISLILEQALPNVDGVKNGNVLTQYVLLLADLLLDGYEREIMISKSLTNVQIQDTLNDEFAQERKQIIQALVNQNYNEQALTLAEKYEDFPLLILICEKINDQEKLEQYKIMFQGQGFTDVLYSYYMDKGSWGKLMSLENRSPDYENFLSEHEELNWLHFIGTKEFSKASTVLKNLANNERENLERKKIMHVLSNLSILASNETARTIEATVEESDKALEIIEYQQKLMKFYGLDNLPPMTPSDLLQTSLENSSKSLDENISVILLELLFLVGDESETLGPAVWKKIILQDSWTEQSKLQYSTSLAQKLVFKCLSYYNGKDSLNSYIQLLNNLMTSDDEEISQTCRIQMKACYEILDINTEMMDT